MRSEDHQGDQGNQREQGGQGNEGDQGDQLNEEKRVTFSPRAIKVRLATVSFHTGTWRNRNFIEDTQSKNR